MSTREDTLTLRAAVSLLRNVATISHVSFQAKVLLLRFYIQNLETRDYVKEVLQDYGHLPWVRVAFNEEGYFEEEVDCD